jgi:hypothetical protein
VMVDELATVVRVHPSSGNGMTLPISSSAATTHFWALLAPNGSPSSPTRCRSPSGCGRAHRPRSPPSCPTRSISTNPGTASSHCAHVRISIASLSSGAVWCGYAPAGSTQRGPVRRESAVHRGR